MASFTITEAAPGVFDVRIRYPKPRPASYFRVGSRTLPVTRAAAEAVATHHLERSLRPVAQFDRSGTLGEWLALYLAGQHDLSNQSRRTYQRLMSATIASERPGRTWLGQVALRRLTDADAGAFIAWAMDGCGHIKETCRCRGGWRAPLGGKTVRAVIVLVRAALTAAVARGVLLTNPWQGVKLPRAGRHPPATPGLADFTKLADVPDQRTRLLLTLAAYTGARRGELLALRWEQIDFKSNTMTIGASLDCLPGGEPTLKEPKTPAARRTITLPDAALAELRLARLEANALAVTARRRIETLPVFACPGQLHFWKPDAATQAAKRALRRLGLPGSLHTLRHAHATIGIGPQMEISPHVMARRLGHNTVRTTLDLYAHAMPADDASVATAFNRAPAQSTAGAA